MYWLQEISHVFTGIWLDYESNLIMQSVFKCRNSVHNIKVTTCVLTGYRVTSNLSGHVGFLYCHTPSIQHFIYDIMAPM